METIENEIKKRDEKNRMEAKIRAIGGNLNHIRSLVETGQFDSEGLDEIHSILQNISGLGSPVPTPTD